MKTKYIFICGGVMSGIGKGTTVASLGRILKGHGFKVTAIKIDPYLNVDAGTMNPIEHGEVFVTEDGIECDQDIGHYERFLDENIYDLNYITSGRVYLKVIQAERHFRYGGKCVETIPHVTNEIIRRILTVGKITKADFVLIEIGGTIGEYQNVIYFEAARILKLKYPKNVLFILVGYLPIPKNLGEMKTKPTQQAVRILNSYGIQPDIIIARSERPLDAPRKEKLSLFSNLETEDIISAPDVDSIYEIPLNFEKDNLGRRVLQKFNLEAKKQDLRDWFNLVRKIRKPKKEVKIAIAGKYFRTGKFVLLDSYVSVIEAIRHASYYFALRPKIIWLDTEEYEKNPQKLKRDLKQIQGVIVPGGFGTRGVEGKIKVIEYCRKNNLPYLGLCFGLQLAVVEFARHVCNLKSANSTEIDPKTKYPVIDVLPEQKELLQKSRYGGTMRLGAYDCQIAAKTKAYQIYLRYIQKLNSQDFFQLQKRKKSIVIKERHRHRYEVNNQFRSILQIKGLVFSGINPEKDLVEIIELPKHRFFLATQFHPEFKSRPLKPHPLFLEFIEVADSIK